MSNVKKVEKILAALPALLQIPQIFIWYIVLETLLMDSLVIKQSGGSYAFAFDGTKFASAFFGVHIFPLILLAVMLVLSLLMTIKRERTASRIFHVGIAFSYMHICPKRSNIHAHGIYAHSLFHRAPICLPS